MTILEKTEIQLGYIPLLDCVALLWAQHRGFFKEQGLNVNLVKEASWASLRDRLCYGVLDIAHCLSAILPATRFGDEQLGIHLVTPLTLSINRAYISLSQPLCYALNIKSDDNANTTAQKICQAIEQGQTIQFAHVFKYSIHHYCLREWLALANTNIAKNMKLSALPPPYMVDAISNQIIDGFCVGEPWNSQSEIEGYSKIIGSSREIIPDVADKVLAMTTEWAAQHPNTVNALVVAIQKAQTELKHLENFDEVWQLLVEFNIIKFKCSDKIHTIKFYEIQNIIRNFVHGDAIPREEDFDWIIKQMQKWDTIEINIDDMNLDASSFVI